MTATQRRARPSSWLGRLLGKTLTARQFYTRMGAVIVLVTSLDVALFVARISGRLP